MHIYDGLMVGNPEAIDEVVELLQQNGFVLKVINGIHDYLSCKMKLLKDKKEAWLGHLHLFERFEKKMACKLWRLKVIKPQACQNCYFC